MRTVVQRVTRARLHLAEGDSTNPHAEIGAGLLALVGIEQDDGDAALAWTARKIAGLRIFEDRDGKMNRSIGEVASETPAGDPTVAPPGVLLVPNFTVAGHAQKGRRPDFTKAKHPREAETMFAALVGAVRSHATGYAVESGVFGAEMHIDLTNDGPVTIWLDSNA